MCEREVAFERDVSARVCGCERVVCVCDKIVCDEVVGDKVVCVCG